MQLSCAIGMSWEARKLKCNVFLRNTTWCFPASVSWKESPLEWHPSSWIFVLVRPLHRDALCPLYRSSLVPEVGWCSSVPTECAWEGSVNTSPSGHTPPASLLSIRNLQFWSLTLSLFVSKLWHRREKSYCLSPPNPEVFNPLQLKIIGESEPSSSVPVHPLDFTQAPPSLQRVS